MARHERTLKDDTAEIVALGEDPGEGLAPGDEDGADVVRDHHSDGVVDRGGGAGGDDTVPFVPEDVCYMLGHGAILLVE